MEEATVAKKQYSIYLDTMLKDRFEIWCTIIGVSTSEVLSDMIETLLRKTRLPIPSSEELKKIRKTAMTRHKEVIEEYMDAHFEDDAYKATIEKVAYLKKQEENEKE